MRNILSILIIYLLPYIGITQETIRPFVWGIAKMTFYITSHDNTRSYYGRFLGFDEAFSYKSPLGKIISLKVTGNFLNLLKGPTASQITN